MEPKVIFEDGWMMVVDKPAGMVTNNSGTSGENTIQNWFSEKLSIANNQLSEFEKKGGVVHRLDKDTSGLLVLAKTPEAYNNLKQQFLERKVKKTYQALIHGTIEPGHGVVSLPVVRHPKVWGKFAVGNDLSRTAVTEWKTEAVYKTRSGRGDKYSFVSLSPLTGRTHQIRVHMKHLNHPIVSDPIYTGRKVLAGDREWCPRLFLHAGRLELKHPRTDMTVLFEANLPEDLATTLKRLEEIN